MEAQKIKQKGTETEMEKVIQIRDAVLKTLKVEVKSLTISGKQMTLAVFRQLIEEPLINVETGELKGLAWGSVNYYWGDCKPLGNYGGHLHVVWQKGDELRRSCEACPVSRQYRINEALEALAVVRAYRMQPEVEVREYGHQKFIWPGGYWIKLSDARVCELCSKQKVNRPWIGDTEEEAEKARVEHQAKREKWYEQRAKYFGWPSKISEISAEDAEDLYDSFKFRETARYELHQKNFAALQTMDQLFIAV